MAARLVPTVASSSRANTFAEQQRLQLTSEYRTSTIAVKYLYGAGSSDNIVAIDITAADPSQLVNKNIGLRLRINGANVTVGLGG